MSTVTNNMELFKYDTTADAKKKFNIKNALNDNWDKIDSTIGAMEDLTTTNKNNLVSAINEVSNRVNLYTKYSVNSGAVDENGNPAYLISYTEEVEIPATEESDTATDEDTASTSEEPTTETHTYLKLLAGTVYTDSEKTHTVAEDVIIEITDKNTADITYNVFLEHIGGQDVLTIKENLVEVANIGTTPVVAEGSETAEDNYLLIPQEPLQAYWVNTLATKTPTSAVNIGSYNGGGVISPLLKNYSDNVLCGNVRLVETYRNGTSWYRIYSDGWCEQGGLNSENGTGTTIVELLKPYKDTNFQVLFSHDSETFKKDTGAVDRSQVSSMMTIFHKTVSSFTIYNTAVRQGDVSWTANGYLA